MSLIRTRLVLAMPDDYAICAAQWRSDSTPSGKSQATRDGDAC